MNFKFDFQTYQRQFRKPLQTSHGKWSIREGIILRLIDNNGKIGWGEIAPLPWFGSETFAQARDFCQQLGNQISTAEIATIPDNLSACQFAFATAIESIESDYINLPTSSYSYLLPAGEAALNKWKIGWNQGIKTFKWKISVQPIATEISILRQLIQNIPAAAKLRLDANGGLSYQQAQQWLKIADQTGKIEFLEQPLPPQKLPELLKLATEFTTPLALDESVATFPQLTDCYQQGWRGIFVIKPGIFGFPQRLRDFCQQHQIDLVFSSVLETEIGKQAALRLAQELGSSGRALGFGVDHWFKEADSEHFLSKTSPTIKFKSSSNRTPN